MSDPDPVPPNAPRPGPTNDAERAARQYRDPGNLSARVALHRGYATNPYPWHRWVFDRLLDLPPGAALLEVGCGRGDLWRENRDRRPAGWRVTLTDLSPGMLAEARGALAGAPGFAFEVAAADALPFGDDAFDAVIANHMLYHVPDRPAALAEIRRVLRPGGRLFAATNGPAHMAELRALMRRYLPSAELRPHRLGFDLEDGRAQLAAHFGEVALERYEGGLRVDAAEPIVAYAASMPGAEGVPNAELDALRRALEPRLVASGTIEITTESGLFTAR